MAKTLRAKINLALIHNNDSKRCSYIRPLLRKLAKDLSSSYDVQFFEVSEQPEVIRHSLGTVLRKKVLLWKLNRDWIKYKEIGPRNIFVDLLILARRLILTIVDRNKECLRGAVDTYVTDKHLRAWGHFLEIKGDFLICFEDDAIFKEKSLLRLKPFLKDIAGRNQEAVFLDLAGGCRPEVLKVKNLESRVVKDRVYYRKPVTNTGCVYLMSRKSAKIFYFYLLRNPLLRLIGADWLLNKLFILSTPKYKYFCYHANPTIFDHGSALGDYSSWL